MQSLRQIRWIAHLALAWFVLAIGVAIASPIVKPQAFDLVCATAGTLKIVVSGDDGSMEVAAKTLDCPMCSTVGAPPAIEFNVVPTALPLSRAVQSIPAARIAGLTAAPLPARGPPSPLAI